MKFESGRRMSSETDTLKMVTPRKASPSFQDLAMLSVDRVVRVVDRETT
jgi:hypothetical protein